LYHSSADRSPRTGGYTRIEVGETPFEPLAYPEMVWDIGARIVDGAQGVRDLRESLARARTHRPSALHTAPIWIPRTRDSPDR
jgi:hypothetical protein